MSENGRRLVFDLTCSAILCVIMLIIMPDREGVLIGIGFAAVCISLYLVIKYARVGMGVMARGLRKGRQDKSDI